MEVLVSILILILLVGVSNIVSHYVVVIPTALIQIGLGFTAAMLFDFHVDLKSDWFMLLFVSPILYIDAKNFPKKELWEMKAPIFGNAVLLVLLTTVFGGLFIYKIVPEISIPLAFVLAAVLSPTDLVAVQGIAEQTKLPTKLLHLVNGESLINDASGLIAFKYALAAFFTGYFSLQEAAVSFASLIFISIIVGFIFAKIFYAIEFVLLRQGIQDVIPHTILQILTPFAIYLMGEMFHGSGIITVFVAGVVAVEQKPLYRSQLAEIKTVTSNLWDIIIYLLNGVIFIILGVTLPNAMHAAIVNPEINNFNLILYVLLIWFILFLIRSIWSYLYLWFNYIRTKNIHREKPQITAAILTGLTGVRGALTMVMVLSLPYFLPDGNPFEERFLVIFLAGGVIVSSLLIAVVSIPLLMNYRNKMNNLLPLGSEEQECDCLSDIEARTLMTKQAIHALKEELTPENHNVITELLDDLDKHLRYLYLNNDKTENEAYHQIELHYRKLAIDTECRAVHELTQNNSFDKRLIKNYLTMLNYKRRTHTSNFNIVIRQSFFKSKRIMRKILVKSILKKEAQEEEYQSELTLLEKTSAKLTVQVLAEAKNKLDPEKVNYQLEKNIINQISLEYQSKLAHISRQEEDRIHHDLLYRELYLKTLDEERAVIQNLIEKGKISQAMASQLRQSVNYNEATFLQGDFN
ncbi:cation:proton antiporter [Vagococcus silagei]|uniref:Sodium:proton antiporter n=1 Tax=Vagococcus silagei TaxID=2508885 RepID=A0A4S3B7I0_9ENTE|nr:sodium:proton antiporter [Vagococcus silagei]THB61606.1 sodium:proton antiporter [Vagococcus silagei]